MFDIDDIDSVLLLEIDAGLFILISLSCIYELTHCIRCRFGLSAAAQNASNLERDSEGRTPGAEMRRWVQSFLAISTASRSALLIARACTPGSPGVAMRALPSMFFLTTYSILAYFWAQLSMALAGKSSRGLLCFLLSGLSLLWLGFVTTIVTMIVTPGASWSLDPYIPGSLRSAIMYLLAFAHAVVLFALLYFGMRIAVPARRRRDLFCRTVTLGTTCCMSLLIRSLTLLAFASGYFDDEIGSHTSEEVDIYDSCYLFVVELLPGATILFLTRRTGNGTPSNPPPNSSIHYSSRVPIANSNFMSYSSTGRNGYSSISSSDLAL